MTIHLEFYHLAMVVIAIIGGFWALVKVIGRLIGAKFTEISEHLGEQDERMTSLERMFNELRVELARDYVHHDDYVRDIGMLATKFEALAINVERMFRESAKETIAMIKQELRK